MDSVMKGLSDGGNAPKIFGLEPPLKSRLVSYNKDYD